MFTLVPPKTHKPKPFVQICSACGCSGFVQKRSDVNNAPACTMLATVQLQFDFDCGHLVVFFTETFC